ncbi:MULTISPECIES: hypothetical protein [Burkholderia]|uniref:hypothetical protein n=1 Tax=Burkholderia TaxID=32008 RepID=UPI00158E5356|nr:MULTISPECIES: hypothetical protein [Burkholderia]
MLNIVFIQDTGECGTRSVQFEIESVAGVSRNLQPPAHDLPACMPEVNHPQDIPISWPKHSPRPCHTLGVNWVVRAAIGLPPVAKTLIE